MALFVPQQMAALALQLVCANRAASMPWCRATHVPIAALENCRAAEKLSPFSLLQTCRPLLAADGQGVEQKKCRQSTGFARTPPSLYACRKELVVTYYQLMGLILG